MATIRKRRGKFQVQIRHRGVRPLSRSFLLRKDAVAWARHMEVQCDRHELPPDPKALQQVILGDLVQRYRDTVTIRKRGGHIERVVLNAFLKHPICRRRISDLTSMHFAAYRDERLQEVKSATLRRQLTPIQNLFEVARNEWGLPIKENPISKLGFKGADQRRERRLRVGEWEKLIEAATKRKNPLIRPVILLALETGMRRGELLAMRWEHINPDEPSLRIPQTKNGHARTIPLTQTALQILGELDRNSERILPISPNAFRLAWERLRKRAGITDLHFHDLRHEAISRFFEKGLTVPEVALLSGHRDPRMLFRYAHARPETVLQKLQG